MSHEQNFPSKDDSVLIKNEGLESGYSVQELKRSRPSLVNLDNGKLTINQEEVEGLPNNISEYLLNEDGDLIGASAKDKKFYTLEGGKEGKQKFVIASAEENAHLDTKTSKNTGLMIGYKESASGEKQGPTPIVNGNSYETFYNHLFTQGSNKNTLELFSVSPTGKNHSEGYFINPKNLSQKIAFSEERDRRNRKINGITWSSLESCDIYNGGYTIAVDFNSERVMFRSFAESNATSERSYGAIVNNRKWSFSSKEWLKFGFENDLAYVRDNKNLVIEDKVWNETAKNERTLISYSAIGGKDGRIAIVDHDDNIRQTVIEGDIRGPQKKWDTKILVKKIAAGKDVVAVCGEDKNEPVVVINDILVPIADDVAEFLDLKIKDSSVFVKYKTALGEVVEREYSLGENSAEYQKQRIENEKREKAFRELQNMLFQKGLNAEELLKKFAEFESLPAKHAEEVRAHKQRQESTEKENTTLESKILGLQNENKQKTLEINNKNQELIKIKDNLETAKGIVAKFAKVTMSSDKKLSAVDAESLKKLIEESVG